MLFNSIEFGLFTEVIDKLEIQDGIKELLDYLKKNGIKTAIVSRNFSIVVERVLKNHGVDIDYFVLNDGKIIDGKISMDMNDVKIVFGYDKVIELKKLCKRIGISKEEMVFIDDSDVEPLKYVKYGILFNDDPELVKEIDYHTKDIRDIKKYIEKWMKK